MMVDDRFELLSKLGGGGMSETHEAIDRQTGRRVVVKRLGAVIGKDRSAAAVDDSTILSLEHPHLGRVLEIILRFFRPFLQASFRHGSGEREEHKRLPMQLFRDNRFFSIRGKCPNGAHFRPDPVQNLRHLVALFHDDLSNAHVLG